VHYFYVLDGAFFAEVLGPGLAASWRVKSFAAAGPLCRRLLATAVLPENSVIRLVADGLPFDRHVWQALVGESLVLGASSVPRLEVAPRSLVALLAPERLDQDSPRRDFSQVEQIHYGSRDLHLGTYYRPEYVGWNDAADIKRLTEWMRGIDPGTCSADALARLPEFADAEERAEELAYVKDWWPPLVELYAGAETRGEVVVCERT